MSSAGDDDRIIDAEIVEDNNVPAVVEIPVDTYRHSEPITKWSEEWWKRTSPEVQANRCVAHKKTGERCRNAAISGATVCRFHGGAAKHVKRAARARLENAADLMAKKLLGIAISGESEAVRLNAIRDALDRAGLRPPSEVVLSQGETKPYETVFDSIGGDPEAAGFSSATMEDSSSAGLNSAPPAMVDPVEYIDAEPVSSGEGSQSSADSPPRQAANGSAARERDAQRPHGAPSPRTLHITGDAAMHVAAELTREQLAIESPHKRYPRP